MGTPGAAPADDASPENAAHCPQRLGDALRWAIRLLVLHQADTPRLDAELLLAHILDAERPQLLIRWDECLSRTQIERYTDLVRRALNDEPVAYLTGERPFYDLTLHVTRAVLIPRPETEQIVEEALAWAGDQPGPLRVVDVGTGSGAIALALARHLPQAEVWAVDLSAEALAVARENAARYGLRARIHLIQSDLLGALRGPSDIIAANLPYIHPDEYPSLQASVRRYEPRLALVGGHEGTAIIERLIGQLPGHLARPGLALLECDPRQAQGLAARAAAALPDAQVRVLRDLAGRERVVRIEREGA